LVAYFSKANYNVFDNITETYGSTGLYSSPFVKIFSLLADKMRTDGLTFIEDSFDQLTLYNLIYTLMSAFYAFVTLAVIYVLKCMNVEINDLLKFLSYTGKNVVKKKKKDEFAKDERKKEISSKSISEDKNSNNS
jgi:hypothetical protein